MRSDMTLRGGMAALAVLTVTAAAVGYGVSPSDAKATVHAAPPPRAIAAAYSPAGAVLTPVTTASSSRAPLPTAAGLTALLGQGMGNSALGTLAAAVGDATTGGLIYQHVVTTPMMPASTAKLATAVSALELLGPAFRLHTRVADAGGGLIVLVGGGDPTLSTGATPAGDPGFQPAELATLAAAAVKALRAEGRTSVALGYDASLYSGPDWPATWSLDDQIGDIAPVDALEVDEGRTVASADSSGRVSQPVIQAAKAFAADLAVDGLKVTSVAEGPIAGGVPRGARQLADVVSPPLTDLVQHMLTVSDNALAEALARQVALAAGQPASFAGETTAVRAELTRLGVDTAGMSMVDACGLSHSDRMTVTTLLQALTLAASARHPELRAAVSGLPVGNFTGTLDELGRYSFGASAGGAGLVRAKTGTLDSVNGLAGVIRDADGRLLVFAFLSNGNTDGLAATRTLDDMATALLTCGCR